MQAAVRAAIPQADGILPYLFYSDASLLKLGRPDGFHAVNIMLAAGSTHKTRSED